MWSNPVSNLPPIWPELETALMEVRLRAAQAATLTAARARKQGRQTLHPTTQPTPAPPLDAPTNQTTTPGMSYPPPVDLMDLMELMDLMVLIGWCRDIDDNSVESVGGS